ncbi:hypothetical protein HS088_TW06G00716 [Tripterygium wilfordii]|uniref:Uncharacterized protein n=1 Tax=Tripterygium wilfordii TaxID=458696 RepID=A0A7J7DJK6_TRIWF|nr:hypothetical protein HS088_TW06G00716 [Tripterygium wilfordii]
MALFAVKHDCVFGEDLDLEEIETVSRILQNRRHDIVYSVSPGTGATPAMAKVVTDLVDMYKIGSASIAKDGWGYVVAHLFVARDFAAAGLIGSDDYNGIWADLDALPFGWVTDPPGCQKPCINCLNDIDLGSYANSEMTFWGITRAPLFLGGDVRNLDDATYDLITNPMLLEMNTYSSNNTEACMHAHSFHFTCLLLYMSLESILNFIYDSACCIHSFLMSMLVMEFVRGLQIKRIAEWCTLLVST